MVIDGIEIKGIAWDSQKVLPGYVYIHLKKDGSENEAMEEAIKKGAAMIFIEVEKELPKSAVPVKRIVDGKKILIELCNKFYHDPLENMKIIGVVGEYGTVITGQLIHHLLREEGKEAVMFDTRDFAKAKMPGSGLWLWGEILASLGDRMGQDIHYMIINLSLASLQDCSLYGMEFDIIVHTVLAENYGDQEKMAVNNLLENLSAKGIVIFNVDDKGCIGLLESLKNRLVITYGFCPRATLTASSIDTALALHFTCCIQRGITDRNGLEIEPMEFPVCISNLGKQEVGDVLAAIAVGLVYGVPAERMMDIFQDIQGLTKKAKYESR
ncbi:hypothetical protein [Thermotalea metallivorans]|uniref:UDP-N-acetylmuramoyl-L-alanyl-D-glutamate--L-lysine ligase n=1 Tax=Thermotalea metallivorans TaxID=520762 RepID=A0A140L3M3_9FIRM|nr:hypothetical protein [Thermotalea metallivorans]KXG75148.1 UDP-N-acetylmuramoyl-L-alanyl-D-glutamate--L-lysine ligase [Thermotalea metallivorans]